MSNALSPWSSRNCINLRVVSRHRSSVASERTTLCPMNWYSVPSRAAIEKQGLGLVQLVTPATPDERLAKLTGASRGFVYAVTITGITGGGLPANLAEYLDKVSSVSPLPVCAGFGIRQRDDVVSVGRHAAGAIVGSALVEVLETGKDPAAFLRELRGDG